MQRKHSSLTLWRRHVFGFIHGLSAYRAANTLHPGFKNQLMTYKIKVAVCFEIRIKDANAMWAPWRIVVRRVTARL
jgi:hypothetical protein